MTPLRDLPARAVPVVAVLLAAALAAACAGAGADEVAAAPSPAGAEALVVARGDLAPRLLLTGELHAARGHDLVVPRAPTWRLQIRWLADDGAEVRAGDPVVEFDSTEFTSSLEQRRLTLAESGSDRERTRARGEVAEAEKLFALEQKRAELAKAESRAVVPPDLLSPREHQDRQLALERARVEVAKAEEDLATTRAANRSELEMKAIELARLRREIEVAERALAELTLRAPVDGLFIVEGNRWEGGRKLQEGDNVFVGMAVARMPDLSSMEVEAMLSDVDDGRLRPGMAARCTLDAYPETAYPCRVRAVAPVAREADRTALLRYFDVGLELDGTDVGRMRPGMSVQVEVAGDAAQGVLLVPRRALDFGATAAATAATARARLADGGWRAVELGPCDAQRCVVVAGLEEGTRLAPAPATLARTSEPPPEPPAGPPNPEPPSPEPAPTDPVPRRAAAAGATGAAR
jgi:HlyD family secretion protein